MNRLSEILSRSEAFAEMASAARAGDFPFNVSGASESQKAHLVSALSEKTGRGALVITHSETQAQRLCDDLSFFTGEECVYIPPGETVLYKVEAAGRSERHKRAAALKMLEKRSSAVMSAESFLRFVVPKNQFDEMAFSLRENMIAEIGGIVEKLSAMGYSRADVVEGRGQFAVRGGILDLFSPDAPEPLRAEFFGDEIESLRAFDPATQLTVRKMKTAAVIPVSVEEENGCVLDYIPPERLIFLDEPLRVSETAGAVEWEMGETVAQLTEKGVIEGGRVYINSYADLMRRLSNRPLVGLSSLGHISPDYRAKHTYELSVKTLSPYGGNIEFLYDDIKMWLRLNYETIILGGSRSRAERLCEALKERGIKAVLAEKTAPAPGAGTVAVMQGSVARGFEYPLLGAVIVSDREIFPAEKKKRRASRKTRNIRSADDLTVGDYVVHDIHGIGRYLGIVKVTVDKVSRDYVKIEYRGGEFLYLPVEKLDAINKYIGSDGGNLRLSKMGGAEWSGAKQRVKQSVADLAEKLVRLYAEREALKGHAFPRDSAWQRQFEDAFPYEETPDQLRCIDEVKEDMQRARPMDRLLCGDVGFGKTEVAMRAAFKAVMEGYQVAYLVPTTILAAQHYNNFAQRMKDFPITVRMLSRFCKEKEEKETLGMLKSGECDIVVGTHKLLSHNVAFSKLGLLVVDEEQRFGVAHKERIKELRKNVDVLTLSATPIPRTLHMAMSGIRDMSLLSTPPEDRYPVQTYVLEHNRAVIVNAIEREIARKGQIYYLSNRVRSLGRVVEELRALLPGARIAAAHGRMNETELENIMVRVLDGEIDVLVCTTIIETGMDIPNVNTIIIENADKLGLAQLYQLRGRVGRTNRRAYAYLTFNPQKALDEIAEKRLRAIKEFTEFGAGFKIALRDLEIRGAGNVLGPEQHGFMASVGYDMYCRLLEEAVNEAMGRPTPEKKQKTEIDISISAFIPETYVSSSDLRIEAYRKIAAIEDLSDANALEEELEDRYGALPQEARRLIDVALLRTKAAETGVYEISEAPTGVMFKVYPDKPPTPKALAALAGEMKGKILYGAGDKPYILARIKEPDSEKLLLNINNVLQCLKSG